MREVLQVTGEGATVRKRGNQVLLDHGGSEAWRKSTSEFGALVLWGSAGVSGTARSELLGRGIPIFTVSLLGQVRGQLRPAALRSDPALHQYERALDGDFALAVSRELVRGKLESCLRLASRWSRGVDACSSSLQLLRTGREKARRARGVDELRGHEGAAALAYYQVLGATLPGSFRFTHRSRRPPRDPVNILLSLGYALLEKNARAALLIAGLDPSLGVFHSEGPGKPSLALDLMEEFRPTLVDRLVVACIARGQIKTGDFRAGPDRLEISDAGFTRFLQLYRDRLHEDFVTRDGPRMTWFDCILRQAVRLAEAYERGAEEYRPFLPP